MRIRSQAAKPHHPIRALLAGRNDEAIGRPFHVVLDHVMHNELMIGCLWAGRTDCGLGIVELMRR
jgi:hypothetical protein